MSTEVEGTCVAVEHKDDTDWAMQYSDEYKRRVKAERRLAAMAFALGGLIKATDDALDNIMRPVEDAKDENSMKQTISSLASLVMEQFDAELMANLYTFDPPQGIKQEIQEALVEDNDQRTKTQERLIHEYFKNQREYMNENWDEALREWELICQQNELRSSEEVRGQRKAEFAMKVYIKSQSDENLAKQLKNLTN